MEQKRWQKTLHMRRQSMVEVVGSYKADDAPPGYVQYKAAKAFGAGGLEQRLRKLNVVVRAVHSADDLPLLIHSAVLGLREGLSAYAKWDKDDVRRYVSATLGRALQTGIWQLLYAVNAEDTNYIYGFLLSNRSHNHILAQYTKEPYRNIGIQVKYLEPFGLDPTKPYAYQWLTYATFKRKKRLKDKIKHYDLLGESAWAILAEHDLLTPQAAVRGLGNIVASAQGLGAAS